MGGCSNFRRGVIFHPEAAEALYLQDQQRLPIINLVLIAISIIGLSVNITMSVFVGILVEFDKYTIEFIVFHLYN